MADKSLVSITFPGLSDRYVIPDLSGDIQTLETAVQNLDNDKVDKVTGKGLSTNDYTTEEKEKLAGIETGANRTVVDDALSGASENPVQNKAVKAAVDEVNARTYLTDTETGKRYTVTRAVTDGYLVETFTEVTT